MVEKEEVQGAKHIISKAVIHFLRFFSGNATDQLQKESRWWKARADTLKLKNAGSRAGNFYIGMCAWQHASESEGTWWTLVKPCLLGPSSL